MSWSGKEDPKPSSLVDRYGTTFLSYNGDSVDRPGGTEVLEESYR